MTAAVAPDAVGAARERWLAAARAVGGHPRTCPPCVDRQDCPAYAALDGRERDAWGAYEAARGGQHGR